ncbi:MAG: hypothetical protein NT154_13585 [Verrucomicrobia bacterium]|nr:hypothetical protein [Verrucomicrobiota bacterium]
MTPSDFQHKHADARSFLLSHEFARALPLYERLTRLHPMEAALWAEYGNSASGIGQIELADQCWEKALGLASGNADLIGMIGHQYQGVRKPEKASACFARAAAADPRSINPRISLAVLNPRPRRSV